ncbi:MAG: GatB/YqeY domain-containing protein [Akkermansiaceae bacterium]|nr:GatB/YqeY domain-containing protein [Akkermansiaceae bacterium]
MSDLSSQLQEDLKTAMKARDTLALNALRALKTALTNAAIEKGSLSTVLDPAEALAVVRKQVKQRLDSIAQFAANNRPELAATEQAEIAILERYLPAALTPDELDAIITAAIAETGATSKADLGKVIKLAQAKADGRADGKTLSQAVMQRLTS